MFMSTSVLLIALALGVSLSCDIKYTTAEVRKSGEHNDSKESRHEK